MNKAIISLDGKQFIVSEGTIIKVNSIENLDSYKVLAYQDNESESMNFGAPFIDNVQVIIEKLEDRLDEKVRVARFRSKSRYRKNKGFRQPISILRVNSISTSNVKKGDK